MGFLGQIKNKKSAIKVLAAILTLLLVFILTVLSYLVYLALDYSRIGNIDLAVVNNTSNRLTKGQVESESLTISTYNIGFGAYSREYSFFMDKAEFKEDYVESQKMTNTAGKYSRAISKTEAEANPTGAYKTISENIVPSFGAVDFALYQEVDTGSTRSYQVDQLMLGDLAHDDYARVFASNYHSGYLMYPFSSPIGASNSGISTYSKYEVSAAKRKEFTVSTVFVDKFFDLDRAFTVTEIPILGMEEKLFIFNVHMSAYDESGEIRKAQLLDLKEAFLEARDANGRSNYIIVGGDFNHDLIISSDRVDVETATWFDEQELDGFKTDWYNFLRADHTLAEGSDFLNPKTGEIEPYKNDLFGTDLHAYGATNLPSARDASLPFQDKNDNGIIDNFMCAIDGFLVSSNIFVERIETIGSGPSGQSENLDPGDPRYGYGFVYSDHNPVVMEFSLIV